MEVSAGRHADIPAHSVIVIDDQGQSDEYWNVGYAARIAKDGAFRLSIDHPARADGHLRILFCFDNGIVSGDGAGVVWDGVALAVASASRKGCGRAQAIRAASIRIGAKARQTTSLIKDAASKPEPATVSASRPKPERARVSTAPQVSEVRREPEVRHYDHHSQQKCQG